MKKYIHCLVILAFLTVGISPACKFISGQMSDIEICTPDGLKTIQVAQDQTPEPAKPDHENHKKQDDCAFCFAQSHLKLAKAEPPALHISVSFSKSYNHVHRGGFHTARYSLSQPRAPPILLS